jgi:DNA-binding response OmpR family regulator
MPKTLLLVEDSFTIQKLIESTFTSAGYQVAIANNAREGLAKLSTVSPDIVLADASMPEIDGFQLCQTIRRTQGLERLPVLLLTSRFAVYDEAQGQRSGVTGYFAKPFDSYSLLSLVQQLVDKTPSTAASVWGPVEAQVEERATPAPGNGEIA